MNDEQAVQNLIREIKRGTAEAHLGLEHQIKPMVLWIIRKQGLSYQEEDLWQDIVIKIWTKIDTFRGSSTERLTRWIRSITYNHCRNVQRSEKAHVIALEQDAKIIATTGSNPGALLESEEFMKAVAGVLKNSLEKKIIELLYMEEFTLDEIARELNKPKNTILSALYRAKKHLRDHFEKLHEK